MMLDLKALALLVKDKLEMRIELAARGKTLASELNIESRKASSREYAKKFCTELLLPPCVGKAEVEILENPDEYLDLVFEHRAPPLDHTNLPTLVCLAGTAYGPRSVINGPGTRKMLEERLANPNDKKHLRKASSLHKMVYSSDNPLGGVAPKGADFSRHQYPAATADMMNSSSL